MKQLALAALVAGCTGSVGTISVSLTTAPGSHVLDAVQTLRLTLTSPHQVSTAERTSAGFTIAFDLPATGELGALIVDGLDASGQLVATGTTPQFPVGAIDARLVVYMAAPDSIGASPVTLTPARSELAAGVLPYGAIFAGGRDATGAPSDAVAIYNAYDHTLAGGLPLPAPRAGAALALGTQNLVYLFGGRDDAGTATGSTWRFDTTVAPSGAYLDLGDKAGFARADQLALPIATDRFMITGAPPAVLSALDGSLVARTDLASLPAAGATVTASDGMLTTIFAGPDGVQRFRTGAFSALDLPAAARAGAAVIALPGSRIAVVCGGPDAIVIDAATGAATTVPNVPAVPRTGCAVAATDRHLLIAGGTPDGGGVAATAEVYDAATLAPIATPALLVPRTGAVALALSNDQILIAGGVDASGAPIETLELFTPSPVE